MSIIKPFKGFRPPVDIVEKLASRPYDEKGHASGMARQPQRGVKAA